MYCPRCGSNNVNVQMFQEVSGSQTYSHTRTKTKQVGHGCLYWLIIGWWWWVVDVMIWIVAFVPRAIFALCRKRKYKSTSTTVSGTHNNISYRQMCVCQNCGNSWQAVSAPNVANVAQPQTAPQVAAPRKENPLWTVVAIIAAIIFLLIRLGSM